MGNKKDRRKTVKHAKPLADIGEKSSINWIKSKMDARHHNMGYDEYEASDTDSSSDYHSSSDDKPVNKTASETVRKEKTNSARWSKPAGKVPKPDMGSLFAQIKSKTEKLKPTNGKVKDTPVEPNTPALSEAAIAAIAKYEECVGDS